MPSGLRIAFFGLDLFSVASLRKLAELHRSRPGLISSLDVYTRSIKPTGRNLKQFVDLPIGTYALGNGLRVFRVDSSAEIVASALPQNYDLAVAVSYGKLIPGKFLASLRYGGLNVHPSLLPKFSGSSPIQHALMEDCKSTGVTVQTLHPTKFDHGDIICQSEEVEILNDDKFVSLQEKLATVGADLLADVVYSGSYTNPPHFQSLEQYSLAPKLSPAKSEVKWGQMSSRQVRRLNDALGPLHSYKYVDILKKKKPLQGNFKVILDDIHELLTCAELDSLSTPGTFTLSADGLVVKTSDSYVSVKKLKFQYCGLESPAEFMKNLKKRSGTTACQFISSDASSL
ncbi:Formyltransferase [Metschnikowia bicuspidata var. bicuspidata NRRL YB-4993]|uniref:methionyl-tRNA formyltransferase n=1 Tax=Metschnikowia bicuspidata var. bicuspidata NRRL YB-4993 TaxID=869754 RepID=A0A1A0HD60_9ASCO|nr:Formyltransferase [Metschnikowia bicuspidata var. bicuspidata NRRL YB-4993]OBA21905.1 Formyltransferase [Metschnikowia bicuspidata var. bicuspidata NRRL YB-4993]